MFEKIKELVTKRKKAMTPEDEPVKESDETQKYRDEATERKERRAPTTRSEMGKVFKKGGSVKSSASRRADGIATKGKTKGRII